MTVKNGADFVSKKANVSAKKVRAPTRLHPIGCKMTSLMLAVLGTNSHTEKVRGPVKHTNKGKRIEWHALIAASSLFGLLQCCCHSRGTTTLGGFYSDWHAVIAEILAIKSWWEPFGIEATMLGPRLVFEGGSRSFVWPACASQSALSPKPQASPKPTRKAGHLHGLNHLKRAALTTHLSARAKIAASEHYGLDWVPHRYSRCQAPDPTRDLATRNR